MQHNLDECANDMQTKCRYAWICKIIYNIISNILHMTCTSKQNTQKQYMQNTMHYDMHFSILLEFLLMCKKNHLW